MDTLLEFLSYAVVAIIAYNVGSHVRAIQFSLNLSQDPDRFIEMMKKIKEINLEVEEHDMPVDAIPMKLETVGTQIYAYNKLTGEFLAQAQNIQQILSIAATRFPNQKFWHPEIKQDSQTA